MPVELNLAKFYSRRQKMEDDATKMANDILKDCPDGFSQEGGPLLRTVATFQLKNFCKARAEQLAFAVGAMMFSSGFWVQDTVTQRKDNCKLVFKIQRMTEQEYREHVLEED